MSSKTTNELKLSQKSKDTIKALKNKEFEKHEFGVEVWLNVDTLQIDADTQRELQDTQVDYIIQNFDPRSFGRITVSKRTDGVFITNGQHRAMACKKMGIKEIPCLMVDNPHKDLVQAKKQDAQQFLNINNNSQTVRAIDKYRVGTSAQIEEWLRVKKVIEDNDCKAGTSLHDINAIACIYKYINSSNNPVNIKAKMSQMSKSIKILKNTTGTANITHLSLLAMCIFIREYIDTEITTMDKVISKFQKIELRSLITNAQLQKNNDTRGNVITYLAFGFWQEYNNKCRKDADRLPNRIYL